MATDGNGDFITYPAQGSEKLNHYYGACDNLNQASLWIDWGNYLITNSNFSAEIVIFQDVEGRGSYSKDDEEPFSA